MSKKTQQGEHYTDADIELIFRTRKSPENAAVLAAILGRTADAIDFVWGWCDRRESFPKEANNRIGFQAELCRKRLGDLARGRIDMRPVQ